MRTQASKDCVACKEEKALMLPERLRAFHTCGEVTQTDTYPVHDAAQTAAAQYYGREPSGAVSDFANGFLQGVVWKEQELAALSQAPAAEEAGDR